LTRLSFLRGIDGLRARDRVGFVNLRSTRLQRWGVSVAFGLFWGVGYGPLLGNSAAYGASLGIIAFLAWAFVGAVGERRGLADLVDDR
jgi:hypothetical protein